MSLLLIFIHGHIVQGGMERVSYHLYRDKKNSLSRGPFWAFLREIGRVRKKGRFPALGLEAFYDIGFRHSKVGTFFARNISDQWGRRLGLCTRGTSTTHHQPSFVFYYSKQYFVADLARLIWFMGFFPPRSLPLFWTTALPFWRHLHPNSK